MKRILPLLLILLLILTGCSAKNADSPAADAPTDTPMTGISYVQIDVKDYGTIVAELYADTADKKTFLYTQNAVYETPLRLYELEEQLAARDFVRAGKSVLLNFAHVAALRPDFGGRMQVTMSNGEVVMASRQYVPALKAKLGL